MALLSRTAPSSAGELLHDKLTIHEFPNSLVINRARELVASLRARDVTFEELEELSFARPGFLGKYNGQRFLLEPKDPKYVTYAEVVTPTGQIMVRETVILLNCSLMTMALTLPKETISRKSTASAIARA